MRKKTIKAISEIGYKQVELMRTDQLETIKPIADDLGLMIKCSHFDWASITGRWDLRPNDTPITFEAIVERAHKNEFENLVFAYWLDQERTRIDDYKKLADDLNKASELCATAGIQLCYHNHSFEYKPMEGTTGWDILVERLDPEKVKFEFDVFWASIGGLDPVKTMEGLKGRIRLLHLKDKMANTADNYMDSPIPNEAFKELGNGVVNIQGVLKAAPAAGVQYCHVEQDHSPDPIISLGTSYKYLADS